MELKQPTCDWCGKFVSYDTEDKGGSVQFIPDTHVTIEQTIWRCPACTEKYGRVDLEPVATYPYYTL